MHFTQRGSNYFFKRINCPIRDSLHSHTRWQQSLQNLLFFVLHSITVWGVSDLKRSNETWHHFTPNLQWKEPQQTTVGEIVWNNDFKRSFYNSSVIFAARLQWQWKVTHICCFMCCDFAIKILHSGLWIFAKGPRETFITLKGQETWTIFVFPITNS